jgi:hypothetical protein
MKDLVKGLLQSIAPTIGTAIGGPLAGQAVQAISNALLGHPNATKDEVEVALQNATPDQLAELKRIELDFKAKMKSLDIDLAKVNASDRDSARTRHAVMKDATPTVLAIGTLIAFFSYIGAVTFMDHSADLGLINVAVGWLGGSASAVISYYFGASATSEGKDK